MGVDVSVIIVNYKTKGLIKDCIKSIKSHTQRVGYEIILVDNASEDITELQSEDVRILQLEENVGFGRANNVGASIAKGNVLFFLNPDTILLNNAIYILYNTIISNSNCGICGGNLYDENLNPAHSYFYCTMSIKHAFRSMINPVGRIFKMSNQHNFSDKLKSVDYITGADLMIEKELFNEVDGFNPNIFMYYEDVDLCCKVRKRNMKCYSVPQAKIQHLEGQSFAPAQNVLEEVRLRKMRMSGDSIAVFLKDNYKKIHYNVIVSANILILQFKLIIYKVLSGKQGGVKRQLDFFKYIRGRI